MENYFYLAVPFITSIIIKLIVKYMYSGQDTKPKKVNGNTVLRLNGGLTIFGVFFLITTIAGIFLFLKMETAGEDIPLFIYAMLAIVALSGIYCILTVVRFKVEFNDTMIIYFGELGKRKQIGWDEITEVHFNPVLHVIKIVGRDKKINVHLFLVGVNSFLKLLAKKVDSSKLYGKVSDVLNEIKS